MPEISNNLFVRFSSIIVLIFSTFGIGCDTQTIARPPENHSPMTSEPEIEYSDQEPAEDDWQQHEYDEAGFVFRLPKTNVFTEQLKSDTKNGVRFDRLGFRFKEVGRGQIIQYTYVDSTVDTLEQLAAAGDTDFFAAQLEFFVDNLVTKSGGKLLSFEIVESENNELALASYEIEEPTRLAKGVAWINLSHQVSIGFGLWLKGDESTEGKDFALKFQESFLPLPDKSKRQPSSSNQLFEKWQRKEFSGFSVSLPDTESTTIVDDSAKIATITKHLTPIIDDEEQSDGIVLMLEWDFAQAPELSSASLEVFLKDMVETYVTSEAGIAATNKGVPGELTSFRMNDDQQSADFTFKAKLSETDFISRGQIHCISPKRFVMIIGSSIVRQAMARVKANHFIESFQTKGKDQ